MRKSVLASFAAGIAALLAVPSLSSADEVFSASIGSLKVVGNPLVSFDISWVDPNINFYLLADRSNAQVDSIPLGVVSPSSFFIKSPPPFNFAGSAVCSNGSTTDCAGPNGVLTFTGDPEGKFEMWVGDGPTKNPFCPNASVACSTVKMYQDFAMNLMAVISTATSAKFPGLFRADELCVAPKNGAHPGMILVANDADDPPYITFIATDGPQRFKILNQIGFTNATGGLEQCQWDPKSDLFFLNFPEDSNFGGDGAVHVFDPVTQTETNAFDVTTDTCFHPQGMAVDPGFIGPSHFALGCNGASVGGPFDGALNSVIAAIDGSTYSTLSVLVNQGGADEVWFEPVSRHFFIAQGGCTAGCGSPSPFGPHQGIQQLGIFDTSGSNDALAGGQDVFVAFAGSTSRRAHSVAAWSGTLGALGTFTIAFVPVPATGGGSAPFSSNLCFSTGPAQGCIGMLAVTPQLVGPEP
jgi:hypothetical protein